MKFDIYVFIQQNHRCFIIGLIHVWGRRRWDRMVVGFTTINAKHH